MHVTPGPVSSLWKYEPTFAGGRPRFVSPSGRYVGLEVALSGESNPLLVMLDRQTGQPVQLARCQLAGPPDDTGNAWCIEYEVPPGRALTKTTHFWRLQQPAQKGSLSGLYNGYADETGNLFMVGGERRDPPQPASLVHYAPSGERLRSVSLPMPMETLLKGGLLGVDRLFLLHDPDALGMEHQSTPPEHGLNCLAYDLKSLTLLWKQTGVEPALLSGALGLSLTEQGKTLLISGTHARQLVRLRTDTGEKLTPLQVPGPYSWIRPLWTSPTGSVAFFSDEHYTGKGRQTRGWRILIAGQELSTFAEQESEFPPRGGIWLKEQLVLVPYSDPIWKTVGGGWDTQNATVAGWLQQLERSVPTPP